MRSLESAWICFVVMLLLVPVSDYVCRGGLAERVPSSYGFLDELLFKEYRKYIMKERFQCIVK